MSDFMRDFANRRGPLWIRMSEPELLWSLAAAFSFGIVIGLAIALAWPEIGKWILVAIGGTI